MYTLRSKLLAIFVAVIGTVTINAQDVDLASLLFEDDDIDYMGQLDAAKLKYRNGMGIYNDGGNVYFGNFLNNKKNGTGMLIAKKRGKIKNLPNCMVYVGAWTGDKKEGKGSCYDFSGNLIYQGRFEDDKPIDEYPSSKIYETRKFSIIGVNGSFYVGEVDAEIPQGYGMFIAENSELSFGKVKDGARQGLGLILFSPYDWKVVKWDGDSYSEITNSEKNNARAAATKQASKEHNRKLRGELFEVALGLASSTTQLVAVANAGGSAVASTVSSSSGASSGGRSSTSDRQKSSVSSKTSNCGTAWQTDSKNYSELETRVMECTDETQYKSLQAKMRAIRTKWLSRDCHITQSEWETKPYEEHSPVDVTNFH